MKNWHIPIAIRLGGGIVNQTGNLTVVGQLMALKARLAATQSERGKKK